MYSVIAAIDEKKYQTKVKAGQHSVVTDEPEILGGGNTGPSPSELLCMSLAACTAITLKMYAEKKQWDTGEIKVEVTLERKDTGAYFNRKILFAKQIETAMHERLLIVADKCPIHKTLSNPVFIETI